MAGHPAGSNGAARAFSFISRFTSAAVSAGSCANINAATPVTWGAAMLVPCIAV